MKLAVLAAVCAAAAALLVPAVSSASPYIQYGVQDDAYLSAGPSLESRLGTLDRMGAKLVRLTEKAALALHTRSAELVAR